MNGEDKFARLEKLNRRAKQVRAAKQWVQERYDLAYSDEGCPHGELGCGYDGLCSDCCEEALGGKPGRGAQEGYQGLAGWGHGSPE